MVLSSRRVVLLAAAMAAVGVSCVAAADLGACDPIVAESCMMPFPNDFYLQGGKTNFSLNTFPLDSTNAPIDPAYGGWNGRDGFSPMGPILSYIPDATLAGAPRLWNISTSTSNTSAWILLDTVTMQRVAHWVEQDELSPDEPEHAFIIWPAKKLNASRRYIVAASGLVTADGSPVTPSKAFLDLRDDRPSSDPAVTARRSHFEDIFNKLAAAGVPKASLDIAWDFTTASQKQLTSKMVFMRDDAISRLGSSGPRYVIDKITDYNQTESPSIAREIQGHYYVPWYLNKPGLIPGFDSRIVLDSEGVPVFQDLQPVNFTVRVPWIVTTADHKPGVIVQYGHGLFGDQSEVRSGYLGDESQQHGYVMGAVDWLGLSQYDEASVALMLATNLSDFAMVPDRCHQGMLDALIFTKLMTSEKFANDPALTFHGVAAYDPSKRYYFGNSQGGILGTVFMSLSTDVLRGCIGVGGGPYGLLLPRSADFSALQDVIKLRYFPSLDRAALFAVFQLLWDDLEPSGYIDAISGNLLPNTPAHRVIFHYGLGDAQVSWLGMHIIARSADAVMYESNVHEGNETLALFPKISDTTVVTEGNVIMGFEFSGVPVAPFINIPPSKKTDTHEKTRRTQHAQDQMYMFFSTGKVTNTCKGACHENYTMDISSIPREHRSHPFA